MTPQSDSPPPSPERNPATSQPNPSEFPSLSPKEALFELRGQNFLIESGFAPIFVQSTILPHYPEIRQSWLSAVEAFHFGTPNLKTASPALQAEAASFFCELRHGDRAVALNKHASLIQALSNDEALWKGVTDTLADRHKPDNTESSLTFRVIGVWLHGCFWAMSNEHRVLLLSRVYGTPVNSPSGNPVAALKKLIQRLKLKGWSNFPQTYPQAPILAKVYHQPGQEPEQDACEIFMRAGDK
jgi:hypothetical protein